MTDHLHPQRETYPLVNTDDTLVAVFRHHIVPGSPPVLFMEGLAATEALVKCSRTLDDRSGLVVVDFSNGALATITIIVDGGAPTVLTEGTEFDAVISNEETALQIAAAINTAAVGLTATTETGSPNVYITPDASIRTWSATSSDATAWTESILATPGTLISVGRQERTELELPTGTSDGTFQVAFLTLFSGRLAVDLRSPVECRTYFRQPATLSGNTGHPGGWPTTP